MKYDPNRHQRRSIRLRGYDYSSPGAYFITICTHQRAMLFGDVVNGVIVLNEYGEIAKQCWLDIPNHFPHIVLDAFVIMPNHVHGIINIVGARHAVPLHGVTNRHTINQSTNKTEKFGKPVPGSIPTIIRSFKSAVTKQINQLRKSPGAPIWQRGYHDHIIRNQRAFFAIRNFMNLSIFRAYIVKNEFQSRTTIPFTFKSGLILQNILTE